MTWLDHLERIDDPTVARAAYGNILTDTDRGPEHDTPTRVLTVAEWRARQTAVAA